MTEIIGIISFYAADSIDTFTLQISGQEHPDTGYFLFLKMVWLCHAFIFLPLFSSLLCSDFCF